MSTTNHDPLSPRRRSALRLDLDDRLRALIDELHDLARTFEVRECDDDDRPASADEAPARRSSMSPESAEPGLPAAIHGRVLELHRLSRAMTALDHDRYGCCSGCARPIEFMLLAQDPLRRVCASCGAPDGSSES